MTAAAMLIAALNLGGGAYIWFRLDLARQGLS